MFRRLVVEGPKRGDRPATSWGHCPQKNLEAFEAILRKGEGRKWVTGVVVKDGLGWMTAAKNVGIWPFPRLPTKAMIGYVGAAWGGSFWRV